MIGSCLLYTSQNNLEEAPYVDGTDPIDRLEDSLNEIIPDSPNKPYDMYEVILSLIHICRSSHRLVYRKICTCFGSQTTELHRLWLDFCGVVLT